MDIQTAKERSRLEEWKREVEACQSRQGSVREWCKMNGVSEKAYYYHLRRVREVFLNENKIVEINNTDSDSRDRIEINYGKMSISMLLGVDTEIVKTVLQVISHAE